MALDIKFLAKTKTKDSGLWWIKNPSNLPQQFFLFNHGPWSRGVKGATANPMFLLMIIFSLPQGSKQYLEALPGPHFIVAPLLPGVC